MVAAHLQQRSNGAIRVFRVFHVVKFIQKINAPVLLQIRICLFQGQFVTTLAFTVTITASTGTGGTTPPPNGGGAGGGSMSLLYLAVTLALAALRALTRNTAIHPAKK